MRNTPNRAIHRNAVASGMYSAAWARNGHRPVARLPAAYSRLLSAIQRKSRAAAAARQQEEDDEVFYPPLSPGEW